MNTQTYRNILLLLQKWPIEQTKLGRDFGGFIRKEVGNAFGGAGVKELNLSIWDEIQLSLNRIASDRYRTNYSVSNIASSTGLTNENCQQVLSTDFLELLKEEDEGKFKKVLKGIKQ